MPFRLVGRFDHPMSLALGYSERCRRDRCEFQCESGRRHRRGITFLSRRSAKRFRELRVQIRIDVENHGAGSIARKVIVAVFLADHERGFFAGVVGGGEGDGGIRETVFARSSGFSLATVVNFAFWTAVSSESMESWSPRASMGFVKCPLVFRSLRAARSPEAFFIVNECTWLLVMWSTAWSRQSSRDLSALVSTESGSTEHAVGAIDDGVDGAAVKHLVANQQRVLCAVFGLEGRRKLLAGSRPKAFRRSGVPARFG